MNTALFLVSFLGASLLAVAADPSGSSVSIAGPYTGIARVTKVSQSDALSITTTIRVAARVAPDGTITILSGVPETPAAAANVASSITRLTRNASGFYFADGVAWASVNTKGKNGLLISYQNPPIIVQSSSTVATTNTSATDPYIPQLPPYPYPPPSQQTTVFIATIIPDRYTKFEFMLTRK